MISPRLSALALCLLALAACTPSYDRLRLERDIPLLAELGGQMQALSDRGTLTRVPTTLPGDARPLSIAVQEVGNRQSNRVVVFVHGVMSDRHMWRYMAGPLGAGDASLPACHLMLVDLPGCGDSDKPRPDDLPPDGYSPGVMAQRVLLALRDRLRARAAPAKVALVGHSLGGTIILRALGDPTMQRDFGDVLTQVDRAVLISPADVLITSRPRVFDQVQGTPDVVFDLGSLLGILREEVGKACLYTPKDPGTCPREEADRRIRILACRATRTAGQAMLRQAVPNPAGGTSLDWPLIEQLESLYANVRTPCLIVWGRRDETLPVSSGYKLQAQIPGARLRIVQNSKHSLPLDCPRECASLTRRFITHGPENPAITEVTPQPYPATVPTDVTSRGQ
jgi:pimeloyl-ACP methyl ester carboxylesterase